MKMPFRKKFWRRHRTGWRRHGKHYHCSECIPSTCTLADVPPGCQARVTGFTSDLSPNRFAYLQAYGLVPGYWVRVIQHSPVLIVQVDHTELALETELAGNVHVADIKNDPQGRRFS
jgi:Fe2+ transport system protein FeoA